MDPQGAGGMQPYQSGVPEYIGQPAMYPAPHPQPVFTRPYPQYPQYQYQLPATPHGPDFNHRPPPSFNQGQPMYYCGPPSQSYHTSQDQYAYQPAPPPNSDSPGVGVPYTWANPITPPSPVILDSGRPEVTCVNKSTNTSPRSQRTVGINVNAKAVRKLDKGVGTEFTFSQIVLDEESVSPRKAAMSEAVKNLQVLVMQNKEKEAIATLRQRKGHVEKKVADIVSSYPEGEEKMVMLHILRKKQNALQEQMQNVVMTCRATINQIQAGLLTSDLPDLMTMLDSPSAASLVPGVQTRSSCIHSNAAVDSYPDNSVPKTGTHIYKTKVTKKQGETGVPVQKKSPGNLLDSVNELRTPRSEQSLQETRECINQYRSLISRSMMDIEDSDYDEISEGPENVQPGNSASQDQKDFSEENSAQAVAEGVNSGIDMEKLISEKMSAEYGHIDNDGHNLDREAKDGDNLDEGAAFPELVGNQEILTNVAIQQTSLLQYSINSGQAGSPVLRSPEGDFKDKFENVTHHATGEGRYKQVTMPGQKHVPYNSPSRYQRQNAPPPPPKPTVTQWCTTTPRNLSPLHMETPLEDWDSEMAPYSEDRLTWRDTRKDNLNFGSRLDTGRVTPTLTSADLSKKNKEADLTNPLHNLTGGEPKTKDRNNNAGGIAEIPLPKVLKAKDGEEGVQKMTEAKEEWCEVQTKKKRHVSKEQQVVRKGLVPYTQPAGPVTVQKMSNFERLIHVLQETFPDNNRQTIIESVAKIRNERGSLSGLTMDTIKEKAKHYLQGQPTKNHIPGLWPVGKPKPNVLSLPPRTETVVSPMSLCPDEEICVICHDPLSAEPVKELDCKHVFHTQCIGQWVERERTCPTCRKHALFPEEFPRLGK